MNNCLLLVVLMDEESTSWTQTSLQFDEMWSSIGTFVSPFGNQIRLIAILLDFVLLGNERIVVHC
jgi:hypothetical protein